jgi:hypothetical protein
MNENMGRKNGLRVPNKIEKIENSVESQEDKIEIAIGVAKANNKKLKEEIEIIEEHPDIEKEITTPKNSSELIVITKAKKLAAYVITITEKSPKKFRAVFVNRMQNYCLDCIEYLIEANSLRMDSNKNREKRKECQHNAFLKLKLLGYISFLALENQCILKKQYQQISLQLSDCINLLVAWRKSDAQRK